MALEIPVLFSGPAFSAVSLTAVLNNVPFAPNLLGVMGVYQVDGVRTVDIAIAERNGQLALIQTSPRGSPPSQIDVPRRTVRKASCVHFAVEAPIIADEVQDALGDLTLSAQPQLQTLQGLVEDRLNGPFGLRQRIELTHEYHRLGGLKGVVVDKDGSELFNWFDFFGIERKPPVALNFGSFTADGGAFEVQSTNLVREMDEELDGLVLTSRRPVALCGSNFYDQVYANKEVKAARKNRDVGRDSDVFTQNKAWTSFTYAGITYVEYRGTKSGSVGVERNEAQLFPLGVPGLMQQLFGPPDIMGLTNSVGLPTFAFMPPERQTSRQALVEAQSNPLTVCLRPRALRLLTIATGQG